MPSEGSRCSAWKSCAGFSQGRTLLLSVPGVAEGSPEEFRDGSLIRNVVRRLLNPRWNSISRSCKRTIAPASTSAGAPWRDESIAGVDAIRFDWLMHSCSDVSQGFGREIAGAWILLGHRQDKHCHTPSDLEIGQKGSKNSRRLFKGKLAGKNCAGMARSSLSRSWARSRRAKRVDQIDFLGMEYAGALLGFSVRRS